MTDTDFLQEDAPERIVVSWLKETRNISWLDAPL